MQTRGKNKRRNKGELSTTTIGDWMEWSKGRETKYSHDIVLPVILPTKKLIEISVVDGRFRVDTELGPELTIKMLQFATYVVTLNRRE